MEDQTRFKFFQHFRLVFRSKNVVVIMCWAKGMFWKDEWQNFKLFVVCSLLFHTWIMVWCVLVVESLWCNNTQTLNSHQIQLECFRWWWQNVYKPLNFTAQSIDAHVSVFVCCDLVFVFVCGVSVGILIRLCRLHCNKLEWNRFFKQKSVFARFFLSTITFSSLLLWLFFLHF